MSNHKKLTFVLHSKTSPAHLEGIATWINHQGEDPPICPECNSDKDVEWDEGEWICGKCGYIISGSPF